MISQAAKALDDAWFAGVAEPTQFALDKKYKAMVRNHLLGIIQNLPQMRLRLPPRDPGGIPIMQKGPDSGEYFEWTIFGNLLASAPAGLAANMLAQAVAPRGIGQSPGPNQASVQILTSEPLPPTRPGYVSGFFPGIWLGLPHDFTFREKLDGYFIPVSTKKVRITYKGRELAVMLNGLLTMIEPDRQICADLLNEIMCMALLLGVPSTAVRDQDLAEAEFYDNGNWAQYSMEISLRRSAILAKVHEPIREQEYETYKPLSEGKLRDIVSNAEKRTAEGNQSPFAR